MVSASILTEATPIITAPDVLKAAGKTFKGGENGRLKVIEVSKDESGRITIRLELQTPTDVVAASGLIGRGAMRRLGRGIPAAVAPAVGGVPARTHRGAWGDLCWSRRNLDGGIKSPRRQGRADPIDRRSDAVYSGGGGAAGIVNQLQHTLTFQAEKGQEPSKLVYAGAARCCTWRFRFAQGRAAAVTPCGGGSLSLKEVAVGAAEPTDAANGL